MKIIFLIGIVILFMFPIASSSDITTGLRAYFNYNTNYNNYTSTNYNSINTLYASINTTSYKLGGGSLNIYSQYSNMSYGNQNFGITGNLYSFSFWLKHLNNVDGSTHYIITKYDGGSGTNGGMMINLQGGGDNLNWQNYNNVGSTVLSITSTGINISDNSWHFINLIQNRTTAYMYVDNVQRGVDTTSGGTSLNETAKFYIGTRTKILGGSSANAINTFIDDLGIYKYALTQANRTYLYNSGTGKEIIGISQSDTCTPILSGVWVINNNCNYTSTSSFSTNSVILNNKIGGVVKLGTGGLFK